MIDDQIFKEIRKHVTITNDSFLNPNFKLSNHPVEITVKHAGQNYGCVWQFTFWDITINNKSFRRFYDYTSLLSWIYFYLRYKGDM